MVSKVFIPPGATEVGNSVLLSTGVTIPKYAVTAVPLLGNPNPRQTTTRSNNREAANTLYIDVITGEVTTERRPNSGHNQVRVSATAASNNTWDFTNFSSTVDMRALMAGLGRYYARLERAVTAQEVNPGYFTAVPEGARPTTNTSVLDSDAYTAQSYQLSDNYRLVNVLVAGYAQQILADQDGLTKKQIVENLKHLAVNVIERVNAPNQYLDALQAAQNLGYSDRTVTFLIHSGYVQSGAFTPFPEARRGRVVRIEPRANPQRVYQKAMDLALKLNFDLISLDYYPDTPTLITVVDSAPGVKGLRKLQTTWDNSVVSVNRLLHVVKSNASFADAVAANTATHDTDADIHHEETDDYSTLEDLLQDLELFESPAKQAELASSLGMKSNPFLSGGLAEKLGMAKSVLSALQGSVRCPSQTEKNWKLFPTSSHPAFRQLSEVTQLDDGDTQNTIPFNVRANNPLKVPKVEGVTDLVTRFGYLGEAGGMAVYRDHIGGAAAGLAYLMQNGQGQTMGNATAGILNGGLSSMSRGSGLLDDVTSMTSSKVFGGMGHDLFGKFDPSGVLQGCATVDTGNFDQTIQYAASLAKQVANHDRSTLTHDEWASAFQIAKNEANEHVTRTTTGVDLPATELANTANTGVMTTVQGKFSGHQVDYEARGQYEKWNPISNYQQYANTNWKPWIDAGLLVYEQKSANTDVDKFAKAQEAQELNQDSTNPTRYSTLEWEPPSSS